MTYAVLQKELEPPTFEQLKVAYREVPGLTEVDAHTAAREAFGVVLKGLEEDQAQTMKTALARQGVETEVVADSGLPAQPAARMVHRFDCTPDALLIYDPLNRTFPLPWANVMLIAAGKMPVEEAERVGREVLVKVAVPYRFSPKLEQRIEYETKLTLADRLLLEVVVTGGGLRYCVVAENARPTLFIGLGDRLTRDLATNFRLLVQDIIRRAPGAALNRGAYYLRENSAQPFVYPCKSAFYREMTWLIWKLANAPAQE